jgi:hypothetical protein
MSWVLVVFFFIEGTGPSNPNLAALNNVPGFQTEELCEAGKKTLQTLIVDRRRGQYHYACLRQQ